tara:strand:+ start:4507 stop:6864 length:2358 start_codon:yes stop_codon:yes gene_type:complete
MTHNILVIGCGGREHAICKSLKKSELLGKLYCWGSKYNPGIYHLADRIFYDTNINNVINYCNNYNIDIVIIGPEQDENKSISDLCFHNNISCIGPTSNYAQIETNKKYAREILNKIAPNMNPIYKYYNNSSNTNEINQFILELGEYVIKANGLKGGKGVKVSGDHLHSIDDAMEYVSELQQNNDCFIIEEKFVGTEFSLMSFTDGTHLSHMPIVRDFKRAYDGDKGPNTGSMGSISYEDHKQPFLTDNDVKECQGINEKMIHYLKDIYNQSGYKGIIYGSFMKTLDGQIKVIEFNSRFGDPECINIMDCLETDLVQICLNIIEGTLNELNISYKNKATVCRYLVPNGYPNNPIKNHEIYVNDGIDKDSVIFSSVTYKKKQYNEPSSCQINTDYMYQCGSRAIAIICSGDSLEDANKCVENNIQYVCGPLFYRTDIGNNQNVLSPIDESSESSPDLYSQAGVDIDKGNQFVRDIEKYVTSTFNESVLGTFGEFSGIYMLDNNKCLISSTDGVGTKSIFVKDYFGSDGFEGLGKDIVNHCTNDILVNGGIPLFFLDYVASSTLNLDEMTNFIKGVSSACISNNCVLIGGETAEMPDVYEKDRVDLVGTIVGSIQRDNIIDGKKNIKVGDIVLGLESSGAHTNGFSLIRRIFDNLGDIDNNIKNYKNIICKLCSPHKSYLNHIKKLLSNGIDIHGLCHITGGGLVENPKRILPKDLTINFNDCIYDFSKEFKFLKEKGNVTNDEMLKVFNCGIGMLIIVNQIYITQIIELMNDIDEPIKILGMVVEKK